jgi:hypothetical protein
VFRVMCARGERFCTASVRAARRPLPIAGEGGPRHQARVGRGGAMEGLGPLIDSGISAYGMIPESGYRFPGSCLNKT